MSPMEFKLQLDDFPGAYLVYDSRGTIVSANQAASDILGTPRSELVGSRAAQADWLITDVAGWPDPENLHPALAAIRSRQPHRGVVARVVRPDGAQVWIQVDAVPALDAGGSVKHVVTTLADLTRIFNDARLPRPRYGDDAIAAVTEQLAGSRLDPASILQAVTRTLSTLRAGTWVAALINKDPRTVRVAAANDADPQLAAYIESMHLRPDAPPFTLSNRVIETGEAVLIPSVLFEEFTGVLNSDIRTYIDTNPPPISSPARYIGVLVAPMRARGAVVGTLGLFERRGSNPLNQMDLRWVQTIADRTGLAAEDAQLYMDAVHRLERLTALRSVRLAISGTNDLRLTLQVILDQAVAGLGVAAADILLVDDKDGMLSMSASIGFQSTSIPGYRLPLDDELPGRVAIARRIETVTVLGAFSQFRRRSLFAREGFKAYGAVPLIARDKLVGVLEVFHRAQLQPDQEWLEFLDALGGDAALAIDRASLFARVQRSGSDVGHKAAAAAPDFTRMERQILAYLVEGLSNRVIAEKVHLSQHTIKFHVGQLLDKVGVTNRTELARKATQERWI
jgi:PAS domain S-box-containing protein